MPERMEGDTPALSEQEGQRSTVPPSQSGLYWFRDKTMSREVLMAVCMKKGELTVKWASQDTAVAKLKGSWRGPLRSSTSPLNE